MQTDQPIGFGEKCCERQKDYPQQTLQFEQKLLIERKSREIKYFLKTFSFQTQKSEVGR